MNRRDFLGTLAIPFCAGCAEVAVRPATPARYLDVRGLEEPPPGEHFFVTVFGSQSSPKLPRFSHTWATMIHLTERGVGCEPRIKPHTISWVPATLIVRVWRFRPEQGMNLGLHETIAWTLGNGERISQWGPYECRPRVYLRFVTQKAFLDTGKIGYQCVDDIGESARQGNGCDCIHAITDMDPEYSRSRYPLTRFGESASRYIVEQMWERNMLIHIEVTHDWLNGPLGLDRYPIIHRRFPDA
jgi:hypothetical protein